MSGIEGTSAEGEIAVAEDPAHPEPLAAVEEAADAVDGDVLCKGRPRVGKGPYASTQAEVE